MLDEVSEAVLAHEEVVKYLRDADGREKVHGYLEELRTTQRYHMYRALQHPVYPILRKIEKIPEQMRNALDATRQHRVVYTSNHRSHLEHRRPAGGHRVRSRARGPHPRASGREENAAAVYA